MCFISLICNPHNIGSIVNQHQPELQYKGKCLSENYNGVGLAATFKLLGGGNNPTGGHNHGTLF